MPSLLLLPAAGQLSLLPPIYRVIASLYVPTCIAPRLRCIWSPRMAPSAVAIGLRNCALAERSCYLRLLLLGGEYDRLDDAGGLYERDGAEDEG